MYELIKKLFPISRSITGKGVVESLEIINKELNNELKLYKIKSGAKVFDWVVPDEWNINEAYIITPDGKKICDFKENNLHVLNYSQPINKYISLNELQQNLYSLPEIEEAIPYVTSYYKKRWGFCISQKERNQLKPGIYKVFVDSQYNKNGSLVYAEYVLNSKKKSIKDEILISTYICHPSLANDSISGVVVAVELLKWIKKLNNIKELSYNYRFVFVPETIGSIVYINQNLSNLKNNIKAGFVLTCMGDNMNYSLIHSPDKDTMADKVAFHVLKDKNNFKEFDFNEAGSDERQYCSPLVDLPVCGICRTKYGNFKQYHTSLDNLDFVSENALKNSLEAMKEIVETIEINKKYITTTFCEPHLGKYGLYPTLNSNTENKNEYIYKKFLSFCNGKNDCIDIANRIGVKAYKIREIIEQLKQNNLIREVC
ncbi:DUF4910 domain-containing protein [Campylobacter pinnipediorum]|uniref:DUF4910 domain-containing protein n=1 Tax=Campylobacter pinnipediorum TaxID=1965231 RepID=UPI00084DE959|nr:DUF4910 domain-containing protein [Campylobacter pinnipediorum]